MHMPPTYPHPIPPRVLPFNVNIADPKKIDKIPDLLKLVADVKDWLAAIAPGVTAQSMIDFTQPGSVLVLGNGEIMKAPDVITMPADPHRKIPAQVKKGEVYGARAEVLNEKIFKLKWNFSAWKEINDRNQQNQKFNKIQKDTGYLIATDDSLIADSQSPAGGGRHNARWDFKTKCMYINAHVEDGQIIVHEYFHTFDTKDNGPEIFGFQMDEGFTDFFARDLVASKNGYSYKGNWPYENGYQAVKAIVDAFSLERVCKIYFERPESLIALIKNASNAIAQQCSDAEEGQYNPAAAPNKANIDEFIAKASQWPHWKKVQQWEDKPAALLPFRGRG